jgi:hypothetical protein
VDSRLFLYKMFPRVATPTLEAPAKQRVQAQDRSISAEPTRRSRRQAALKSSVPVSKRASSRLMRELELVGPDERILEAASKQYEVLFQGPLAPKSIATLRVATRLGHAEVSKVAAVLAADELAAQVELAAA